MKSIFKKLIYYFPEILLGLVAFLLIVGPQVLNPENISWLKGDASLHHQGWAFFRNSEWTIPLGSNPKFGQANHSSIVYSDSIPLMAFFFKPFSPILPVTFQYLGIWTLICFILQAVYSSKLISLFTSSRWIQLLASGVFLISCPMLNRIALHTALVSHFLILWALFLYFKNSKESNAIGWALLLGLSALVHFYIFTIVAYIWMLSLVEVRWSEKLWGNVAIAKELSLVILFQLFIFWQAGYFLSSSSSITAAGYGAYPMNALSLFDSQGWSNFIRGITKNGFDEGFNYVGLGGVALLIFAIPSLIQVMRKGNLISRKWKVLLYGLIPLYAFSITNNIHIGTFSFQLPLPSIFLELAGILRASGRIFWPVFYVMLIASVALILRFYSKRICIAIFFSTFALQAFDTSPGWLPYKKKIVSLALERQVNIFKGNFWLKVASQYSEIIAISPAILNQDIALFGAQNNLALNNVPMARSDGRKNEQINIENIQSLKGAGYKKSAIYFLPKWKDNPGIEFSESALSFGVIAQVDGYSVFLPNWKLKALNFKEGEFESFKELNSFSPVIEPNIPIDFSLKENAETYLLSGWGQVESLGPWADSKEARLVFPVPKIKGSLTLNLNFRAFINHLHPLQRVVVVASNGFRRTYSFTNKLNNIVSIPISDEDRPRYIFVQFELLDVVRPIDLGISNSDGNFSLGLVSASYSK